MILVTGASGFVGRNVVKALRTRGKEVRCFIRTPSKEKAVAAYHVEMAYGDILTLSALKEAMRGVDTVVHLVAIIREKGKENFDLINRSGTEIVTQAAKEEGVRHFVHLSAIGAQDNPAYPYLYSKWQGEQAVINSGLTYTIFRPSFQFGEGDEFINTLAGVVKAFPIVPVVGSGKVRLQPISVEEVGAMISLVVDDPHFGGRTIEIGGPDQLTYNEIMDIIGKTLKVRRLRAHLPLPLMKGLTRIMEAVISNPPATSSQLELLALDNVTDIDSVEKTFKVKPRSLEGNISYIRNISLLEAWRIALGFMPRRIRIIKRETCGVSGSHRPNQGMVDYERPSTTPGIRARYDLERIEASWRLWGTPTWVFPRSTSPGPRVRGALRPGRLSAQRRGLPAGLIHLPLICILSGREYE